jgi:hypothetical protein
MVLDQLLLLLEDLRQYLVGQQPPTLVAVLLIKYKLLQLVEL